MDARLLLTINTGSSRLKAALYRLREDTTETPELRAEASRIGGRGGTTTTPFDMVVLNGMSRYQLAAEALRRASKTSGSRLHPVLRVRGGDRKGHRLLEGALRGSARDTRLDLDTMDPPTETLMMGLLKDQDREGSRGTDYGA